MSYTDWGCKMLRAPKCMSGAVYANRRPGFLCLPRKITQRLVRSALYSSANQMHGWTSGATRFGRTLKTFFAHGARGAIWLPGRRFDLRNPGQPLGLGKDQGMEVLSEAWGCLPSVPASRRLRLSGVQCPLPHRAVPGGDGASTAQPRGSSCAFCGKYACAREMRILQGQTTSGLIRWSCGTVPRC